MMLPKPPRTSTMESAIDIYCDTLQPAYEDPDASRPAVTAGSQPEVKIGPVPRPRSKLQPKVPSDASKDAADSVDKTGSATSAASSQLSEHPAHYKRPRPVRPPPKTPPPAVSTERTQSPPPPRPARPATNYDRSPLPRLKYESTFCASQTRPPPPQFHPPPPPPAARPPEALYYDVEYQPYLEVLPDREDTTRGPTVSPRRPSASHQQVAEDTEDVNIMLRWLNRVSKSDCMAPSVYGLSVEEEMRSFSQRATNVRKALRLYNLLMVKRNESLRGAIAEFTSISCSLDKMAKKTKTVNIAGGTAGTVGGVTAVLGIALAPMTMGASLIATAVGAGMVASAGGIGVQTAKANKKTPNRMTVEKLVCDYKANIVDLEHCLDFILSAMNELRRHDIARLQRAGAQPDALQLAHLSRSVFLGNISRTGGLSSEKLLQAFANEMDQYFTEKQGQKLKKSNKSKFSGRVRLLAENLQDELDHLNRMWEMFC